MLSLLRVLKVVFRFRLIIGIFVAAEQVLRIVTKTM